MIRIAAVALLACLALVATGCGLRGAGLRAPQGAARGLPVSFAANHGQFAPRVRYAALGAGYELAATDAGLELALAGQRVRIDFAGARAGSPAAGGRLPGVANYLLGRDRRRWRTGVPTYREVVYRRRLARRRRRAVRRGRALRVRPARRPGRRSARRAARLRRRPRADRARRLAAGRAAAPARAGGVPAARRPPGRRRQPLRAPRRRHDRRARRALRPPPRARDRPGARLLDLPRRQRHRGGHRDRRRRRRQRVRGRADAVDRPSRARGRCGAAPTPSSPGSPRTAARSRGAPTSAAAASTRPTASPPAATAWSSAGGRPRRTSRRSRRPRAANAGTKDAFLLEALPRRQPSSGAPISAAPAPTRARASPSTRRATPTSPGRPTRRTSTPPTRSRATNGGGSDAFAAKVDRERRARLLDVSRRQRQRRRRRRGRRRQRLPHGRRRLDGLPHDGGRPAAGQRRQLRRVRHEARPDRRGRVLDLPRRHGLRRRRGDRAHAGRSAGGRGLHAVAGLPDDARGAAGPPRRAERRLRRAPDGRRRLAGGLDLPRRLERRRGRRRRRRRRRAAPSSPGARCRPTSRPSIPCRRSRAGRSTRSSRGSTAPARGSRRRRTSAATARTRPLGAAVDGDGNAYVAGRTGADFPTDGALQGSSGGGLDAFVAKLSVGSALAAGRRGRPRPAAAARGGAAPAPRPGRRRPRRPSPRTRRPPRPTRSSSSASSGRVPGQIDPSGGVTLGCRRRRRRLPAVHVALHDGAARARRAPLRGACDERQRRRRPDAGRLHVPRHATARGGPPPRVCAGARRRLSRSRDARLGPVRLPGGRLPARGGLPDGPGRRRARRVVPVQLRRPPPAPRGVRARPVRLSRQALLLRAVALDAGQPQARGALRPAPRRVQPPARVPRAGRVRARRREPGAPRALALRRASGTPPSRAAIARRATASSRTPTSSASSR